MACNFDFILCEKDQNSARRFVEHDEALGNRLADIRIGATQQLHQNIAGHMPLLRGELAGRDTNHIGQTLSELAAHGLIIQIHKRRIEL